MISLEGIYPPTRMTPETCTEATNVCTFILIFLMLYKILINRNKLKHVIIINELSYRIQCKVNLISSLRYWEEGGGL